MCTCHLMVLFFIYIKFSLLIEQKRSVFSDYQNVNDINLKKIHSIAFLIKTNCKGSNAEPEVSVEILSGVDRFRQNNKKGIY